MRRWRKLAHGYEGTVYSHPDFEEGARHVLPDFYNEKVIDCGEFFKVFTRHYEVFFLWKTDRGDIK